MSFRKTGYIQENSRRRFPKRFLFFDTESYIVPLNETYTALPLRLGVAIYTEFTTLYEIKKRKVYCFSTAKQFIAILLKHLSKRDRLHVMAHNLPHDIMTLNLIHELHSNGFESSPPIINHRLFIFRANSKAGGIVCLDTANYSITSIEQLGKDLGFAKLSIDFETCTDNELYVYCQRDVEIIERFVQTLIRFIHDNNLGSFTMSLASQALSAWKYRFMEQSIYIHNDESILTLEKDAYHGGRVECYQLGTLSNDNYYYLDINSMYPTAMRNYQLPFLPLMHYTEPDIPELQKALSDHYVIAKVNLDTQVNAYPYNKHGLLVFPIGRYVTCLHSPELEIALQTNSIVSIQEMITYEQAYLFTSYVDFYYNMKTQASLEHNDTNRLIAKLYLNGLYGKFGQKDVTRIKLRGNYPNIIHRWAGFDEVHNQKVQEFIWFGSAYREIREGLARHSSPAVSGAVTARARCLLYGYMQLAGRDNLFYVDTDSLIVNQAGYENLTNMLHETELGKLKIERQSDKVTIRAPKDYTFGTVTRRKGIPYKAKELEDNTWEIEQWLKVNTWLNNGANSPPLITKRTKHNYYIYNKGETDDNGAITPYFRFDF